MMVGPIMVAEVSAISGEATTLPDAGVLRWLYERMVLIRIFEERIAALRGSGGLQGSAHLYAGQEAVAAGVCAQLERGDYVASTHRGHGHAIAKGVDVARMMAELYGRSTGTNGGKGGSMHIADTSVGMLGATGIVGAGTPIALGAALSAKTRKTRQVSVAFFGDGAMGQGPIYECMNMAAIWKLPMIFVCENNGYAESTSAEYALSTKDLARRADAFNIPSVIVDGQDVLAVYAAMGTAVARGRAGEGPTFLECKTYRYYGHFLGDDPLRYRTADEETYYRGRDCIQRFEEVMRQTSGAPNRSSASDANGATSGAAAAAGRLSEADMESIRRQAEEAVDAAVVFAEQSPRPDVSALTTQVYTEEEL